MSGKRYQAETLDDPSSDSSCPFGNIRAAGGSTLTLLDNPPPGTDKRLYRLRVLGD